jgi:hypothetical protein
MIMKTKKILAFWLLAFAIVATSCDKNEENDDDDFSPIPVAEHKTKIENAGFALFDEMKLMEQEPAMQANISLGLLLDSSAPFGESEGEIQGKMAKAIAFAPVYATTNYKNDGLDAMLKTFQINPAEEPETIQAMYDELIGIYEWNDVDQLWDYTQTGNNIQFLFPSEVDGTSNNASYTITYQGYTGPNPIEDYDGDLPQLVQVELKVDGTLISSFTFEVDYNTEGYPTLIEVTYTMGTFEWYMMASNTNNAQFATEYSFKHGSTILLKLALDASGNWTKENIENNITEEVTYYGDYYDETRGEWVWGEVGADDEWYYADTVTEFNAHKVIKNGNASFQVMNLKVAGAIDVEGFGTKMLAIDEQYDWETQEEQIVAEQTKAINDYISLSLRYADTDDVIAFVEAYPVSESYTYQEYWYDGEWHETPITVTETDYWFEMRFVFADGSKVDAATYFDDVFENLIADIESYLDDLELEYGK